MSKNVKEILNQFNTEMAEEITPTDDTNKPEDNKIDPANSDEKKENPEDKKEEPKDDPNKDKPEDTKEPEKKDERKTDEPEDKKEPENKNDEKITGLEAEIERLKGELAKAQSNNADKTALDQANALLNVEKGLVSEYEGIITAIIDAKLADVPENLKELVPENLNIQQKLDWINKAEKSGIFKAKDTDIEIGKPLNPNNSKQNTDTSKLSASSLMAMAYGNAQKGKGKK